MRKTYKVLFLVENAPIPGDPRVWNEAVALRDAGYKVSIIAPHSPAQPLLAKYSLMSGINVYRFKLLEAQNNYLKYLFEYSFALWSIFWLSLKVWRRHGFDVLHVANPPDIFFLLALFYGCFGKKFVFDQHDLSPELCQVLLRGRAGFLYCLLRVMERCSYRLAHLVIVTNESFRRLALERGRSPAQKVFVVRNGPDLADFKADTRPAKPFFPHRKKYILAYAGVMGKQDGVEYALYALHYLIHIYRQRDVSAVFIGHGSARHRLQMLVKQLELDEHVYFTGWLERPEVVSYLAHADIGLSPDPRNGLNEFCTMLKTMEYMALGLPVVAFDLDETRAVLGEAALYAQPNSSADFARLLARLLNCAELRHSMGIAGRRRVVEELSWEHSRKNLLLAYATLFAGAKTITSEPSACAPETLALAKSRDPDRVGEKCPDP
ncbi:MAG TPA: glycosyltransferase family 4 protein [Ktedonobacteraceae bacterium]